MSNPSNNDDTNNNNNKYLNSNINSTDNINTLASNNSIPTSSTNKNESPVSEQPAIVTLVLDYLNNKKRWTNVTSVAMKEFPNNYLITGIDPGKFLLVILLFVFKYIIFNS